MRVLLALCVLGVACTIERRPEGLTSDDNFERAELGPAWRSTLGQGGFAGGTASANNYRIVGGELVIDHAYNHPVWLTRALPRDAVIELDCWSNDVVGDLKLEVWGDGKSYATSASYTSTGYVFIFGGWHNQISAIARMNEHGADRRTRNDPKVVKGQRYHFRIERKGKHIDWQVDGKPFLTFDDPAPLDGPDHAYLGFNDWEAELHFDNLRITPL